MRAMRSGQGTNSLQIRQYNQRLVLRWLRRLGEASKADLARAADLTSTAVGQIVDELDALGLVETVGKRHRGQRGQPATILRLNRAGAYGIGVRLDRSRIETALVDLGGHLLAQYTHDIDLPSPAATLDIVQRDVEQLLAFCTPEMRERITGIGIGRPYNLGSWLQQLDLVEVPSLREWDDADFAGDLTRATGLATVEENDGAAAAIAELFHGLGHEADNFLYLFIGPCIGGGLAMGGDYLRGETGNAADVAVMPVGPSRLPSAPQGPETNILLTRASLNALIRHLRHCGARVTGLGDLAGAMNAHPRAVEEWMDDCVDALVGPLLSMRALLDISLVALDSDLDRVWIDRLIVRLEKALAAGVAEARTPPLVRAGHFGPYAGALGAASLPLFVHLSPRTGILTGEATVGVKGGSEHVFA